MSDRPLCLVGMSGVGKSFWAKRLEAHGFLRRDCDGEIAAQLGALVAPEPGEEPVHALGRWMGMPWHDGYAAREAAYLALEERVTRAALSALVAVPRAVLDTTGSVVYLSPALLADLCRLTRVVYLRTPPERCAEMLRRYQEEPKPVVWGGLFDAGGGPPEAALPRCYEALLAARDARYRALAHVVLDAPTLLGWSVEELLALL